jgi:hypothetical protein
MLDIPIKNCTHVILKRNYILPNIDRKNIQTYELRTLIIKETASHKEYENFLFVCQILSFVLHGRIHVILQLKIQNILK